MSLARFASNAAILIVSVVVALVAAEFGLRFVYRDLTTPTGSWFGLRWLEAQQQGGRGAPGLREPGLPPDKQPGIYRVVVIGDSFTAAIGIDPTRRFHSLIEQALNENGGGAEVVALGRPGHEIHHHLRTLRGEALGSDPDFVLLQWYVNDFDVTKEGIPRPRPLIPRWPLHRALYRASALYTIGDAQWRLLQVRLGLTGDYAEWVQRRYTDPVGPKSREAMDLFVSFFAHAEIAGVPAGMVMFPHLARGFAEDYPFAFLHDRVIALCALRGLTCVDLREAFSPWADDVSKLRLNRFDHHAGPLGQRLAAEALLRAFGARWRARGG